MIWFLLAPAKILILMWCSRTTADDSKIVGGFTLSLEDAPFLASVNSRRAGSHICGGSLLSLSHVLTACHCMATLKLYGKPLAKEEITIRDVEDIFVIVGTENVNQIDWKYGQSSFINNIVLHPNCSYTKVIVYDFAILRVERSFQPNVKVKPFSLVRASFETLEMKTLSLVDNPRKDCLVAGWGEDGTAGTISYLLRATRVRVIADEECGLKLGRENSKFNNYSFEEHGQLCTLPYNKTANTSDCQGDSGGPFFCGETIYGVISYGYDCGYWDTPNVYAKLSYFVDWYNNVYHYSEPGRGGTEFDRPRLTCCRGVVRTLVYFILAINLHYFL